MLFVTSCPNLLSSLEDSSCVDGCDCCICLRSSALICSAFNDSRCEKPSAGGKDAILLALTVFLDKAVLATSISLPSFLSDQIICQQAKKMHVKESCHTDLKHIRRTGRSSGSLRSQGVAGWTFRDFEFCLKFKRRPRLTRAQKQKAPRRGPHVMHTASIPPSSRTVISQLEAE